MAILFPICMFKTKQINCSISNIRYRVLKMYGKEFYFSSQKGKVEE